MADNRPVVEGQILLIDGSAHAAPHAGSRYENDDTHVNNIQTLAEQGSAWFWFDATGGKVLQTIKAGQRPGFK